MNDITPFAIVMVLGLVIAVGGHISRSRTVILIGLLLIGLVSVYFGFVVARVR